MIFQGINDRKRNNDPVTYNDWITSEAVPGCEVFLK